MITNDNLAIDAPTAIGGLGGSGTRVFAALLQEAGIHIGDCLNEPLDNLWFTVLFKRAQWADPMQQKMPENAEVATSVRLFQQAMKKGLSGDIAVNDRHLLSRLHADLPPQGVWRCGANAVHANSLIDSIQLPAHAYRRWGWKEPNTHIFLPHLDREMPNMRYIHIVRDGLDMAFSHNNWQMRHWGHLYGCQADPDKPWPAQQLRFWTKANRAAIDYGRDNMAGRFLVIHYEDFCSHPDAHWARMLRFLDLPDTRPLPNGVVQPSSIGRSEDRDLSVFSQSDLHAARAVQATVDEIGKAG